jgi:putative heme-binding domain-containing protein
LVTLLESGQPAPLRDAALAALRGQTDPQLARDLVERWRALAPAARVNVINLLLQRVAFHDVLMTAIEQDRIKLGELNLDLEQRRRLLRKSSPEIKARAAKYIGDEEYSNRKTVVEDWLKKMPATGEASRGRLVFDRLCAQCHALDGIGNQVGPDLGASSHRGVEDLLSNILDPNMAINPNYVSFTAETTDGEIETGLLKSETTDAVVLLQALNKQVTLPRRQLRRFESSGVSLMPEGLEAGLTPADLRDLIAFLQSRR